MALSVQNLYEDMVRMFGSTQSASKFESDFISAVNFCLDKMSFAADLSTALAHIQASDATISALDEDDSYILQAGLEWKLKDYGQVDARNTVILYGLAKEAWDDALGDFMVKKHREDQASTDADGNYENDIIGLGTK